MTSNPSLLGPLAELERLKREYKAFMDDFDIRRKSVEARCKVHVFK